MKELIDNMAKNRYEMNVDGLIPFVEYTKTDTKDTYLTYTKVPSELEGRGVGSELVKSCLEKIKAEGRQVVPMCPFVASYIRKNPEWRDLIKEGFNV